MDIIRIFEIFLDNFPYSFDELILIEEENDSDAVKKEKLELQNLLKIINRIPYLDNFYF